MNHAPTHESFSDLVSCGPTKKPFHCFCVSAASRCDSENIHACKRVRFWLPLLVKTENSTFLAGRFCSLQVVHPDGLCTSVESLDSCQCWLSKTNAQAISECPVGGWWPSAAQISGFNPEKSARQEKSYHE